ncbi:MAG: ergothioneine biosynthesis protein EgtB [SAR324 cluster bacterium]|nr:ergothioneine biosynthesis protein EgtB [SAR324 cluster bacterium]
MKQLEDKHFTLPASELIHLVNDAHQRTLDLLSDLDDSQLNVPLLGIVNPFRWEMGHVSFFYEAMLLQTLDQIPPLTEDGNDFYNSFEIDHDDRWGLPLPSRKETLAYMEQIRLMVIDRLGSHEPDAAETYIYLLSVFHEDMHGEAFTWMRQTLKYPKPSFGYSESNPPLELSGETALTGDVEVPGGNYQLGASRENPFVFDNEKWAFPIEVPSFRIARTAVSNDEFKDFIEDNGYKRPELWSTQGWRWRSKNGMQCPVYWARGERDWLHRHFNRWIPLASHAPVAHISWYEAEAYCRWAGRRLPTEAEWDMAASAEPSSDGKTITGKKRRFPWGDEHPTSERANLDGRFSGTVDVGAFPAGDSAFGCRQMLGNVWEWTASPFYPFPGYIVDFPYVEYSAPWFGYPKVLKGGAWPTRSRLACNSYRNFFPPHRNDIFSGFRTCALE